MQLLVPLCIVELMWGGVPALSDCCIISSCYIIAFTLYYFFQDVYLRFMLLVVMFEVGSFRYGLYSEEMFYYQKHVFLVKNRNDGNRGCGHFRGVLSFVTVGFVGLILVLCGMGRFSLL